MNLSLSKILSLFRCDRRSSAAAARKHSELVEEPELVEDSELAEEMF